MFFRFAFVLLATILTIPRAHADALSELVDSEQYKGFLKQVRKADLKGRNSDRWVDNRSEFSTLFDDQHSSLKLLSWLSPNTVAYSKFLEDADKKPQFARVRAKYAAKDDDSVINLTVLVPHPRFAQQAAENLIKAFSAIRIAPADTTKNEIVKVRSLDARAIHTKSEQCLLSVELSKGTLLQLSSQKCKDEKRLIDFARTLDLGRTNKKLSR